MIGAVLLACVGCATGDGAEQANAEMLDVDGSRDATLDAAIVADGDGQTGASNCRVTHSNPEADETRAPTADTWSYDPVTRRLITTTFAYDIDEAGRTLRVYGRTGGELVLYWTNHYDEHGYVDNVEHYTSGLFTYANTYESERLVSVELRSRDTAERTTYHYEDPTAPAIWTRADTDTRLDGALDRSVARTILERRTALARVTVQGQLRSEFRFVYSGGRIETIERDGSGRLSEAPDGTPDMRFHWERDAQGNVTEFTQDGTDSRDNPFVNGVPDFKEEYSSGCAALLTQFPWLAHEPAPNSIGPRSRDDRD